MEEHREKDATDQMPLLDGIRVHDKPRIALVRANPFAVGILLFITLLGITGTAYVITKNEHSRHTAETILSRTQKPVAPPKMQEILPTPFERWNFSVTLPLNVQETENVPITDVPFAPTHTYTVTNTTCRIAYGTLSATTTTQTHHARTGQTNILRDNSLVTRIERRTPSEHTVTDVASSSTPYEPHEFAFAYYPLYYRNETLGLTRNAWILFSSSDTPVSEECHTVFADMLQTLTARYDAHALTRTDTGILYIEHDARVGARLLFRSATDNIARSVATLDTGLIFTPTLFEDTLYYIRTDGTLGSVSLFSGENPHTVPLSLGDRASVHDYAVTPDGIYYLSGTWCIADDTPCDLTLGVYDTRSGTTTVLHTGITTPNMQSLADAEYDMPFLSAYVENPPSRTASLLLKDQTVADGSSVFEGIENRHVPITRYY